MTRGDSSRGEGEETEERGIKIQAEIQTNADKGLNIKIKQGLDR